MLKNRNFPGRERFKHFRDGIEHRKALIQEFALELCDPVKMNPYKQVKLYTKCRKFIPEKYWDDLCPRPCQEAFNYVEGEKNKRKSKGSKGLTT